MNRKIIPFIFSVVLSTSVFAQADEEYSNTLKRMFEVSGTQGSFSAVIDQMFTMSKQQYPQVDAAIWDELKTEFSKTSLNDLTEMLVPVYSKYMTQKDLEKVIKFYETPVGKKFAENTPLIMQESMQVGQQWGMKIGQEFEQKMKEKGY